MLYQSEDNSNPNSFMVSSMIQVQISSERCSNLPNITQIESGETTEQMEVV